MRKATPWLVLIALLVAAGAWYVFTRQPAETHPSVIELPGTAAVVEAPPEEFPIREVQPVVDTEPEPEPLPQRSDHIEPLSGRPAGQDAPSRSPHSQQELHLVGRPHARNAVGTPQDGRTRRTRRFLGWVTPHVQELPRLRRPRDLLRCQNQAVMVPPQTGALADGGQNATHARPGGTTGPGRASYPCLQPTTGGKT